MIDLVDLDSISLFVDTEDLIYAFIPEERKRYTQERHLSDPAKQARTNLRPPEGEITGENVVQLVLEHHWGCSLPFAYLDVGCQYGYSAITVAGYIRARGHDNRLIGFEPGWAARFAWPNVILNGLHDRIELERQAVSDADGTTTIFHDPNHSENDRLVNPEPGSAAVTVPKVSLDTYAAEHGLEDRLIVKVDVQGGEPLVLDGMRRLVEGQRVVSLLEFTPHAMFSCRNPLKFLEEISSRSALIAFDNIFGFPGQPADSRGLLVEPQRLRGFMWDVVIANEARPWCDLLVIPWSLPDAASLVGRITGG